MEQKERKSVHFYMRLFHRYIGFFVIGLTLVYGFSGIIMVFRDTDFLKQEKHIEKQVPQNLKVQELGQALRIRNLEGVKVAGDTISFKNGWYNKATGQVQYTEKSWPAFIEKLSFVHKTPSKRATSFVSILFALSLIFLAISSFWMFKPKTKFFRNGMIVVGMGVLVTIILLLVQ
jgi:hypothetical protein